MIELKSICKNYDENIVLDNVDLTLHEDRVYGLLGKNSIGKTTLMKILTNQIVNYQGDVLIDGANLRTNTAYKESLIIVSDDFLTETLRGEKIKSLTLFFTGLCPNFNKQRYDELMKLYDISPKMKYDKLSFGKKSLFRSIIGLSSGAKYIYLDEPATGLDEINRDLIYQKILEYQAADESMIMISSHILTDVERIVTDIVMLSNGKVLINEAIEDVEDKAYSITLNDSDIKLLDGKNILNYKKIGNQMLVHVYDEFSRDELNTLRTKATVVPMNLSELFKAVNKEK